MDISSRDRAARGPALDDNAHAAVMSIEAGPSRCHMESSFYTILHSSGFAEWAARAEVQNQQLGVTSSRAPPAPDSRPGPEPASAFREPPGPSKKPGACPPEPKDDPDQRPFSSPHAPAADDAAPRAKGFAAHSTNYSAVDAELAIIKKHLVQRGPC